MTLPLQAPILPSVVLTQFLGVPRSNDLLLALPQKLNIGPLLLLLRNFNGHTSPSKSLVYQLALHQLFTATTLVQNNYARTWVFILAWRILLWTTSSFETQCKTAAFGSLMLHKQINWRIHSPNHSPVIGFEPLLSRLVYLSRHHLVGAYQTRYIV